MAKRVSYETWQKRAQACAERLDLVSPGDNLFDEEDPFDLVPESYKAWQSGVTPSGFVREAFGEDLAERANDRDLARGG